MPTCDRQLRGLVGWAVVAACALIWAVVSPVAAEQGESWDGRHPGLGCAKAKAMAASLRDETVTPADEAYREAMDDTDVLHYELDIEVSNLDAVSHNCSIAGSNRMTIQSKVAALTEFSFRLRSQYTITSALIDDTTSVDVTTASTTTRVVDLDPPIGLDDVVHAYDRV